MRVLLILVSVVMLAGGAGYYYYFVQQPVQPVVEAPVVEVAPKTTDVFVPSKGLSAGVILKPEHLGRLALDPSAVSAEMIAADDAGETLLVGSVARHALVEGLPIARSAVVQPGDRGFLAAVLPTGKRAISIPITATAGVSGLAMPGDRVDIILTYGLVGAAIDVPRDVRASETVLSNIRVLALDQRLDRSNPSEDDDGAPIASTATLQVSPREAEMITLATTLGDLSMVLNSVHDGGDEAEERSDLAAEAFTAETGLAAQPRSLTLDSDVTSLLRRDPPATPEAAPAPLTASEQRQRIQIVRGTSNGSTSLTRQNAGPDPDAVLATDSAAAPVEVDDID